MSYENETLNKAVLEKISAKCYAPTNHLLYTLIKKYPTIFNVSLSFSGVFLEQLAAWQPEVLASFKKLVGTGQVEVFGETYYHSLASVYQMDEFSAQVKQHKELIEKEFSYSPTTFRNTELIYKNELSTWVKQAGYTCVVTEGAERVLKGAHPNQVFYSPYEKENLKILVRNYHLSDEISFRFSDKNASLYPLTPLKFLQKIIKEASDSEVVNIFMDYETFGEHQWEDTGIFEFLNDFIVLSIEKHHIEFVTPAKVAGYTPATKPLNVEDYISWADTEKDLSAWLSNSMQYEALHKIYSLRDKVLATQNVEIIHTWRKLQTSDHFYYMCTKHFTDGDVHAYFSPFPSPYDAYIFYMNILSDFELFLKRL